MERLQPLLDRVWARDMAVEELAEHVDGINRDARKQIAATLRSSTYGPLFRKHIEDDLHRMEVAPAR
jgi:hypothetical protein